MPFTNLACDLHTHSNYSDGALRPADVVDRAAAAGVTCLALTDHDETRGLHEARARADELGIEFVNGVEISVTWRTQTLHVIGLQINPDHAALAAGLAGIRTGRDERAGRIAEKLARAGIEGSLDGARAYAANPELVSRTHFARFVVDQGHARDLDAAFRRFLGSGAIAFVPHQWAELRDAVGWIRASGGLAVLAHPARYKLDRMQCEDLLSSFRDLGGTGIEVVSGNHAPDQAALWGKHAVRFGLLASAGSDFHGPHAGRDAIGGLPELPGGCVPVWKQF
jgi:predicted metal-dependent phosphoesterase TrpH